MAAVRTTCLGCALAVAQGQQIGHEPLCSRCYGPMARQVVVTSATGHTALSVGLFGRVSKPRRLSKVRLTVKNITAEQFGVWVLPTWQHFQSLRKAKEDRDDFLVTEWADVKALCSFEHPSVPTREPSQGKGNVRAAASGELAVVVPPLVLSHR